MSDNITITAVGDIIAGDHPLFFGIGVRTVTEKENVFVFEHVEKILSQADVVCGNLETALSDCTKKQTYNNMALRGSPNFIKQLKKAHFNVLNIANNHIQQHGDDAVFDTINLLNQNKIKVIGISNLHPQVIELKNIKLGFLGYSLRPEDFANKAIYSKEKEEKILSDVAHTKEKVDKLIVSLHWGDEFVTSPSSCQIDFAHQLIDSGASIILGHHPHVLQGIEKFNDGIIAYSLGNFISDRCQEQARKNIILKLNIDKKNIGYEVIPCKINNKYQPVPLSGRDKEQSLDNIKKLSEFATLSQAEYEKSVKDNISRFRKEYRCFLIKNWYRYPIKDLIMIILGFIRRKLKLEK